MKKLQLISRWRYLESNRWTDLAVISTEFYSNGDDVEISLPTDSHFRFRNGKRWLFEIFVDQGNELRNIDSRIPNNYFGKILTEFSIS